MSIMKLALALAFLAFAGCKEDPSVAEVAALADKMCACKDVACADTARQETIEYAKQHQNKMVSREENRKVHDHMERAKGCFDALTKPVASTDIPPAAEPAPAK